MKLSRRRIATLAVLFIVLAQAGCGAEAAKKFAVASSTFASGLENAQQALEIAVVAGQIGQEELDRINPQLSRVAEAGLVLNNAIRNNQSNPNVSVQVNNVITALNELVSSGVAGIKNENVKLSVSLALTGARSAIAIIASVVGDGGVQ